MYALRSHFRHRPLLVLLPAYFDCGEFSPPWTSFAFELRLYHHLYVFLELLGQDTDGKGVHRVRVSYSSSSLYWSCFVSYFESISRFTFVRELTTPRNSVFNMKCEKCSWKHRFLRLRFCDNCLPFFAFNSGTRSPNIWTCRERERTTANRYLHTDFYPGQTSSFLETYSYFLVFLIIIFCDRMSFS